MSRKLMVGFLGVVAACGAAYLAVGVDGLKCASPPSEPAAEPDTEPPPPPPPAANTIKVASWNILNLGDDTPVQERAEVIAQYDIVAL